MLIVNLLRGKPDKNSLCEACSSAMKAPAYRYDNRNIRQLKSDELIAVNVTHCSGWAISGHEREPTMAHQIQGLQGCLPKELHAPVPGKCSPK